MKSLDFSHLKTIEDCVRSAESKAALRENSQPPVCERCRDRGYVRVMRETILYPVEFTVKCECRVGRENRALVAATDIPVVFRDATLCSASQKPGRQLWQTNTRQRREMRSAAVQCVKALHGYFTGGSAVEQRGLLLCGEADRGKTHLACAVARDILDYKFQHTRGFEGVRVAFHDVSGLNRDIARAINNGGSADSVLARLESCHVVILDDIVLGSANAKGRLEINPKVADNLRDILKSRVNTGLPIIATTNHTFAEIEELDPRISSRLAKVCRVFECRSEVGGRTLDAAGGAA